MARQAEDTDETKTPAAGAGTEVVAAAGGAVPAFMAERAKADAGKGTSQLADDNLVPMVYLLQSGSPQTKSRDPDYIPGAKEGDIWLKNSGLPPIDGDVGMLFQPCFFAKNWVEWKPNRGGFAGAHDERPAEAAEKEIEVEGKLRKVWMLPSGNLVNEVRSHIGRVFLPDGSKMPYVIPMTGSQHTVSRGWMARMNTKTIAGIDGPAPSWACLYRLKVKGRKNDDGSWVVYDIYDEGWVQTAEDYEAGAKLHASFASGEKKADTSDLGGATGGEGAGRSHEAEGGAM